MPPKRSAAASSKKRPLEAADPNAVIDQPPAKQRAKRSSAAASVPATAAPSGAANANNAAEAGPSTAGLALQAPPESAQQEPQQQAAAADLRDERVPCGPNGEEFLPRVLPGECAKKAPKACIPGTWVWGLDGTPERVHTLGNRLWWAEHRRWIEANRTKLGITAAMMARRDTAQNRVKPNEGREDWDFVCTHQPSWDKDDDDDEDDECDDDDDAEEDGGGQEQDVEKEKEAGEKEKCDFIGELASLHPGYLWVFSMLGMDRNQWWTLESLKRDQDQFSMHVYNDFTAYGMVETVENIVAHIGKVLKSKDATYQQVWSELEGAALMLNGGFIDMMYMCDDGEKVGDCIGLLGITVLQALDYIKKSGHFRPAGTSAGGIPNLGLVLALFLRWGHGFASNEMEDEMSWLYKIIDLADSCGVELVGPRNISDVINDFREKMEERWDGAAKAKWTASKAAAMLRSYRSKHGAVGGREFDITKMSDAERKRYSYGY